jgi:hypothetical protein
MAGNEVIKVSGKKPSSGKQADKASAVFKFNS